MYQRVSKLKEDIAMKLSTIVTKNAPVKARVALMSMTVLAAVTALLLFGDLSAIEGWMLDRMVDTIHLLWKLP